MDQRGIENMGPDAYRHWLSGEGSFAGTRRRQPAPGYAAQGATSRKVHNQCSTNQRSDQVSPSGHGICKTKQKDFLRPGSTRKDTDNSAPIEINVSNLDQSIKPKQLERCLCTLFADYEVALISPPTIYMQLDARYAATVKVSSMSVAKSAINLLNGFKLGDKHINLSLNHGRGHHSSRREQENNTPCRPKALENLDSSLGQSHYEVSSDSSDESGNSPVSARQRPVLMNIKNLERNHLQNQIEMGRTESSNIYPSKAAQLIICELKVMQIKDPLLFWFTMPEKSHPGTTYLTRKEQGRHKTETIPPGDRIVMIRFLVNFDLTDFATSVATWNLCHREEYLLHRSPDALANNARSLVDIIHEIGLPREVLSRFNVIRKKRELKKKVYAEKKKRFQRS